MNCKIVGTAVQYLEVELMPGESFFTERGSLIYFDDGLDKEVVFNGRGLLRIIGAKFSGESVFILRMFNPTSRPRKMVIGSQSCLFPLKIQNEAVICHRGVYVASSAKVDITTKLSLSGFIGGMGLKLQKIKGTATIFLDTIGTAIPARLGEHDSIQVDENHIICMQGISERQISANWSLGHRFSGEGWSMMRISGPGTVYLSPGAFYASEK